MAGAYSKGVNIGTLSKSNVTQDSIGFYIFQAFYFAFRNGVEAVPCSNVEIEKACINVAAKATSADRC